MVVAMIPLYSNTLIYDSNAPQGTVQSSGTEFTYLASGTAGQSVVVEASMDGVTWFAVVTLAVKTGNVPDAYYHRHTYPFLRKGTGAARLQISRGGN